MVLRGVKEIYHKSFMYENLSGKFLVHHERALYNDLENKNLTTYSFSLSTLLYILSDVS